ncbi:MAG TPA: histidine phosphatase family protein, partial [Aquihabitans sp.]|nr:histidine phosphatase family protein [Aquihabitans sp.]
MELILVRHGEPAWELEGRGRNDPNLTERGHSQATAMARRLADPADHPAPGRVERLIVSPAQRAQETAAPVAEALAMEAETEPWLLEIQNPPEFEGSPIEDIQEVFQTARTRPRAEAWDGLPGGEPVGDFHERVTRGLLGWLADQGVTPTEEPGLWEVADGAPERVVAVAHAGTNSTIIARLLDVAHQPWDWDRFAMGHASVAVLTTVPMAGAHLWSL